MKNNRTQLTFYDYSIIVGVTFLFIVGIFLTGFYILNTHDECVKDPFIYGSKKIEGITSGAEVMGILMFINHPEIKYIFNSTYSEFEYEEKVKPKLTLE